MSVKKIESQSTTKANATGDNAYKVHTNKYIEHDQSKPITTSMREKWQSKHKNAYIQAVLIEFLRKQE